MNVQMGNRVRKGEVGDKKRSNKKDITAPSDWGCDGCDWDGESGGSCGWMGEEKVQP